MFNRDRIDDHAAFIFHEILASFYLIAVFLIS